jgi:hypothetical protein
MAAFVAKQMVGNKLSAVKGELEHKFVPRFDDLCEFESN